MSPESDSDEALPSSQTLVQSCLSSQRSLSPSERALARQELKRNLARSTAEKEAENELKSKQENEPEEKPVTKKGQNKKRKLPPSPASTSPETRPKSPAAKKRAVKSGEEGKKTIVPYTAGTKAVRDLGAFLRLAHVSSLPCERCSRRRNYSRLHLRKLENPAPHEASTWPQLWIRTKQGQADRKRESFEEVTQRRAEVARAWCSIDDLRLGASPCVQFMRALHGRLACITYRATKLCS